MVKPIIYEGEAVYVVKAREAYEIVVHSTNYTTHIVAGTIEDEDHAIRFCKRLDAYPRQTRQFYGLL